MTSQVEQVHTETRNHPICRHLVPMESILSFPVPARREGRVYLRFHIYQRGPAPQGQPRPIYRPHARLSVEYPTGRPVEYVDLLFAEGAPATPSSEVVGAGLNPALVELSFPEVIAKRSALFEALEAIVPLLGRESLTAEERGKVADGRTLWESVVEPGLQPFYRALNPAFFDWLHSAG